ncbi:MAG: hypothetical protein KGI70_02655 [Patescibacteria group bacterium]|nr:hypothetical protein [Patescibacteria group bacterium]
MCCQGHRHRARPPRDVQKGRHRQTLAITAFVEVAGHRIAGEPEEPRHRRPLVCLMQPWYSYHMHHAYVYEGPLNMLQALARDARARMGFEGEHSPNVLVEEIEKFGIDDAHELRARAGLRTARALFVLGVSSITSEAQQALLKLFEEPQKGVVFVLLVPHGTLVPTLRSRMLAYPTHIEDASTAGVLAKKFLSSSAQARSDIVAELLEDEGGEKERVRELLTGLEGILTTHMRDTKVRSALEDIARVRGYIADRSASLKMLLEHLALALPTI